MLRRCLLLQLGDTHVAQQGCRAFWKRGVVKVLRRGRLLNSLPLKLTRGCAIMGAALTLPAILPVCLSECAAGAQRGGCFLSRGRIQAKGW